MEISKPLLTVLMNHLSNLRSLPHAEGELTVDKRAMEISNYEITTFTGKLQGKYSRDVSGATAGLEPLLNFFKAFGDSKPRYSNSITLDLTIFRVPSGPRQTLAAKINVARNY